MRTSRHVGVTWEHESTHAISKRAHSFEIESDLMKGGQEAEIGSTTGHPGLSVGAHCDPRGPSSFDVYMGTRSPSPKKPHQRPVHASGRVGTLEDH